MKRYFSNSPALLFICVFLLSSLACNALAPAPTATVVPSPIPPTATLAPLISQQVTLISQPFEETNQTPPFTIKLQTPQLVGSDDPRVLAFNQRLSEPVTNERDLWRKSFLENTLPPITEIGSFVELTYTQTAQYADIWSFKYDVYFYSDGAAHPGSYSMTLNYDLAQGKELALSDLFLPSTDYLSVVSNYCIAELGKQPFFEGPFAEGAQPKPENYARWNITPSGLMITFDAYQVAPYAAGPQVIQIPIQELLPIVDPAGPLNGILP
jgi:hypothetical protein